MLRTNRTSEDAMDHLAGNELFPIFMFLSVGSIALFSFIVTPALTCRATLIMSPCGDIRNVPFWRRYDNRNVP